MINELTLTIFVYVTFSNSMTADVKNLRGLAGHYNVGFVEFLIVHYFADLYADVLSFRYHRQ